MEHHEGRWGQCCCWEPAEGLQGKQNGINRLDGVCCPSGGAAELWGRMLCFLGFMINQKLLTDKVSDKNFEIFFLSSLLKCGYNTNESISHSVVSDSATPWTIACQAPLCMDSLGKNTGVGNLSLLQGIFPTQGSNPGFLHCNQIIYCLRHQGNPNSIS